MAVYLTPLATLSVTNQLSHIVVFKFSFLNFYITDTTLYILSKLVQFTLVISVVKMIYVSVELRCIKTYVDVT